MTEMWRHTIDLSLDQDFPGERADHIARDTVSPNRQYPHSVSPRLDLLIELQRLLEPNLHAASIREVKSLVTPGWAPNRNAGAGVIFFEASPARLEKASRRKSYLYLAGVFFCLAGMSYLSNLLIDERAAKHTAPIIAMSDEQITVVKKRVFLPHLNINVNAYWVPALLRLHELEGFQVQSLYIEIEAVDKTFESAAIFLKRGAFPGTRSIYRDLAAQEKASGADGIAETYTPDLVASQKVQGVGTTPTLARQWIEGGAEPGNAEAYGHLDELISTRSSASAVLRRQANPQTENER